VCHFDSFIPFWYWRYFFISASLPFFLSLSARFFVKRFAVNYYRIVYGCIGIMNYIAAISISAIHFCNGFFLHRCHFLFLHWRNFSTTVFAPRFSILTPDT